jgi:hypothetical protein
MTNPKDDFLAEFGHKPGEKSGITVQAALQDFWGKIDQQLEYARELNGDEEKWKNFKSGKDRRWFRYRDDELFSKLGHNPLVIGGKTEFGPIAVLSSEQRIDVEALESFYAKARKVIEADTELQMKIFESFEKIRKIASMPRDRKGKNKPTPDVGPLFDDNDDMYNEMKADLGFDKDLKAKKEAREIARARRAIDPKRLP